MDVVGHSSTLEAKMTNEERARKIIESYRIPFPEIKKVDALLEHDIAQALSDARRAALESAAMMCDEEYKRIEDA